MMRESLVMTIIGRDRPGLVESVSAVIEKHGGNWEESRLVQLAGEFAGVVHVRVPADRASDLETALGSLEGMSVTVAKAPEEGPPPADTHYLELDLQGQDHPGIVHRVTEAIAARRINIVELESEVGSAPMTGQRMFQARARMEAPKSVSLDDLERDLEGLAADLMVDIRVEKPDG